MAVHYLRCGRIYRFLIMLVDINPQRVCCERVHVSARTERSFTNVGPREVWLNTGRRFRHAGDRSCRGDRRYFIVAWRKRNVLRNPDLVVEEFRVGFTVWFKLRKRTLLRAETIALHPRL